MAYRDLTQSEKNALQRVRTGHEIDPHMWDELLKQELVERRGGRRVLTAKGKSAIGVL